MRAFSVTVAALAVLAVSGCDINTGTPRTAKVDCNCTPPAATASPMPPPALRTGDADEPPLRHRSWHHGGRYSGGHMHGTGWRAEYAGYSVITYDYHSGSHSYYEGDAHGGGTWDHDDDYRRVDGGWVDGYGRAHGSAGDGTHGESPDERGARMHPWHGYDARCRDDER